MSVFEYYLVAGATGRQGGAVIKALLTHPSIQLNARNVFAISRQPDGPGAKRLRERYEGINIVCGDLKSSEEIFQQLDKNIIRKTGVFLAQAHGPTEVEDGKAFINAAEKNGVPYFVYSSVDRGGLELSDRDPSYCKTFSDKFLIEQHLKNVCGSSPKNSHKMDYTILRPTWFADNAWWGFPGQLCMTGWRENLKGKTLQVTVTKDIGRWAAEALMRPDRSGIRNQALSIASEELSFDDVDRIFKKHTTKGVPVTYNLLARFVIWAMRDLNTMFQFIGERTYGADLIWLKTHLEPTTFETWVEENVPRSF
ncbi:hypothetical protein BGZ63DRAFT_373058 [Mariannaea sp. PMI_226]|nr:hypothetical protein BGZ63DRAFT_373058 [Mariannaea sp. PMI_226]